MSSVVFTHPTRRCEVIQSSCSASATTEDGLFESFAIWINWFGCKSVRSIPLVSFFQGVQPHIMGLLSLYKLFCPHLIALAISRSRKVCWNIPPFNLSYEGLYWLDYFFCNRSSSDKQTKLGQPNWRKSRMLTDQATPCLSKFILQTLTLTTEIPLMLVLYLHCLVCFINKIITFT